MSKLDWEVELGTVIGKSALNISKNDALDHVLGYTLVNDVCERARQMHTAGNDKRKKSSNFLPYESADRNRR